MTNTASSNEPISGRLVIRNRSEEATDAAQVILSAAEQMGYDRASCFAVRLALEEALSNAFRHGNKYAPEKVVRLTYTITADHLELEVEDEGDGFDPESVPDPTEQENIEIPSGRGLTLMRAFMTELNIDPPGNRVRMRYVKPT